MSTRLITRNALNGGPPLLLTRMSASGQAAIRAGRVLPRPFKTNFSAQARPSPLLEAQTIAMRPEIPRSNVSSRLLDTSESANYKHTASFASSKRHENLRSKLRIYSLLTREGDVAKHHGHHRYRTLFLSDLHLGTRGCQAHLILDMLRHVEADTIYLVGDIIDGWRLRSGWYWPQAHNDVMQKLLRKVRRGARMVFVPGNHDEFARQFFGLTFGGIEIKRQAVHSAADGKRYLITHGDEFDVVVRHSKWLAYFGDWAYTTALFFNTHFNAARRALGLPYWSFSAWAKLKVKNAVNFIGSFEKELAGEAKRRGVDGVVCGHIHHPIIREIDGVTYVNSGDFVESCSLVVEHFDGRLEVMRWPAALKVLVHEDNTPFEDEREQAEAEAA
jgi:UDP-2,3-diacylglucosamine pyrophosphatase LpxH